RLRRRGRRKVSDDEDLLARPHQPQLAAGDFLDGRRIFPQSAHLLPEPGVLRPLAVDRARQPVVLTTRPAHREQSAIADERVDDAATAVTKELDEDRQYGHADDANRHEREILFDDGNIAEKEAGPDAQ